MSKKMISLLILVAMLIAPTAAFAASPWTDGDSYGDKVAGKLEFGVKNLLGGWTELYNQPAASHANGENWFGGFGVGIVNAVVYTVGGALHTATFPIPVDIPLPNNGVEM